MSRDEIVQCVSASLNATMFHSAIPIANRHRWRGLCGGLEAFCLHQGCWGLGARVFRGIQKRVDSISGQKSTGTQRESASAAEAAQVSHDRGALSTTDFESHMSHASIWISSSPCPRTFVLRMSVELLRLYQGQQATWTSQARNKKLQIQDVFALKGRPSELAHVVLFYNLLSGAFETDAMRRTMTLLTTRALGSHKGRRQDSRIAGHGVDMIGRSRLVPCTQAPRKQIQTPHEQISGRCGPKRRNRNSTRIVPPPVHSLAIPACSTLFGQCSPFCCGKRFHLATKLI